jgi:AcrR family transcriptional regulator
VDLEAEPANTRRRGAELEGALLDAAWDELEQNGYPAFTFDAVAQRAHTSRPVLYRRWSDRDSLVLAAISHRLARRPSALPDTGSVRGDLIALMQQASIHGNELITLMSTMFGGYYSATGQTIEQIRARILENRSSTVENLLERARDRGERVPADPPEHVTGLLGDLLRQQMIMSLEPPTAEYITAVVDEIILPLFDYYADREDAAADAGHPAD